MVSRDMTKLPGESAADEEATGAVMHDGDPHLYWVDDAERVEIFRLGEGRVSQPDVELKAKVQADFAEQQEEK
tara:strand:- start:8206 stop:8424 length:219 start_codon:yes stop_codon:yes gene_type:complete